MDLKTNYCELVFTLSEAVDLVSTHVARHHLSVAYIANSIARELCIPVEKREKIIIACALHDVGSLSLKNRIDLLMFETEDTFYHSELGYILLKMFTPFTDMAGYVRYHHTRWNGGKGSFLGDELVPAESHIIHIADRISVLIKREPNLIHQSQSIVDYIKKHSGSMFVPEMVEAFESIAARDYFWLDLVSLDIARILQTELVTDIKMSFDDMTTLTRLFSHIIDFRSNFTATHSMGVGATSSVIAKYTGMSDGECKMMTIAGHLHDLGKLAVPSEILDKPSGLTKQEFGIMRSHAYHTGRILASVGSFHQISQWCAFHHERLDGKGYPYQIRGGMIPLGSRVLAAADIFTAIAEDRPYRKGMSNSEVMRTLDSMAAESAIDGDIVSIIRNNYSEIDHARISAKKRSIELYKLFSDYAA